MIRYSLACDSGHDFESWFRSADDFDTQNRRGFVACPECGSVKVAKQVMAPSVARTDRGKRVSVETKAETAQPVALVGEREQQLRAMIRALRDHVAANAENVGTAFPEEARKIHYGESEQRSIYGEASPEAVESLLEEGVELHPLPSLPEDRN